MNTSINKYNLSAIALITTAVLISLVVDDQPKPDDTDLVVIPDPKPPIDPLPPNGKSLKHKYMLGLASIQASTCTSKVRLFESLFSSAWRCLMNRSHQSRRLYSLRRQQFLKMAIVKRLQCFSSL